MPRNHVCLENDHISKLAADNGFEHWSTIWDENGSLKSRRSNPNLLFKGDRFHKGDSVRLPAHDPGSAGAGVDAHHPFTTGSDKLFLRLRLLKDDFTALANAQYTLTIEGAASPFTGKTNAQGQLEHPIPRTATQGSLAITPPSGAAPGGGVSAEAPITLALRIGRLNPIMENAPDRWCISGVQQRLNNLGISSGKIDGIKGRLTETAVIAFQRTFGLKDDGKPGQGETQPKLKEVHDKPDSVLGPKTPPTDSQESRTPEEAYGHVCPDFDDRKVFNTLRLRSTYRLTLRLGSIEELCPHAPATVLGRMERLQLLGMFYVPLGHKFIVDPVRKADGTFVAPAASKTCWDWISAQIFPGDDVDAKIQDLLLNWIIAGGALPPPAPVPDSPPGGGPPAAPNPTADNFKKLRLPGGFTFFKDWSGYPPPHYDANYAQSGWLDDLYAMETLFYRDNPVLGKIPLVAKVEKMNRAKGEWEPTADAWVYFQLIKPYDLPAFDATKTIAEQIVIPPIRATNIRNAAGKGPKQVVDTALAVSPDASGKDPQVNNAHVSVGGKRGQGSVASSTDVCPANNPSGTAISATDEHLFRLFKITETKGFNAQHGGTRDAYTHKDYKLVVKSDQADFTSAVKAQTNEEGEVGVIFMPSRCGGDRYRLRACLGPTTAATKPDDAACTKVETGTLVTWRNLRISQFIRQPTNVAPSIDTDWKDPAYNRPTQLMQWAFGLWSVDAGTNTLKTFVGMAPVEMAAFGDNTTTYDGVEPNFARAFCELSFDNDAAKAPRDLTDAEFAASMAGAIAAAKQGAVAQGLAVNIDWAKLFYRDRADVDASTALAQIPMRTPKAYNALVAAARRIPVNGGTGPTAQHPQAAFAQQMGNIINAVCQSGWMQTLSQYGHLPGVTFFDGARFATWIATGFISGMGGVAMEYRSFYGWIGSNNWPARDKMNRPPDGVNDYTAVMAHEFTHCHFRSHAIGNDPPGQQGGGAFANRHDKLVDAICLMSYKSSEAQLCGKCLLALRGFDIKVNAIANL